MNFMFRLNILRERELQTKGGYLMPKGFVGIWLQRFAKVFEYLAWENFMNVLLRMNYTVTKTRLLYDLKSIKVKTIPNYK